MGKGFGRDGYTIVEVLIVIVVLVMMLSMLPSALPRSRVARMSACRGNLKTIGTGLQMYAMSYDGWYPYYAMTVCIKGRRVATNWRVALTDYVGGDLSQYASKLGSAQSALLARGFPKIFTDPEQGTGEGYYGGSTPMFFKRRINSDDTQEREGCLHWEWAKFPGTTASVGPPSSACRYKYPHFVTGKNLGNIDFRHRGKANILYMDCRVQSYGRDERELAEHWNVLKVP